MEFVFNCSAEQKQVGRFHTTIIILSHPENEESETLKEKGLHQLIGPMEASFWLFQNNPQN